MKRWSNFTSLACALALATQVIPAQAGENMNRSDRSMLMATFAVSLVIVSPVLLSMWASADTQQPDGAKSRRNADDKLPDMEVKQVNEDDNGNPRVYLQVPNHPEQNIRLIWQKSTHNPTAAFREGSMISFKPSPQGSGWLLHDGSGAALAFVPVEDNASANHSALF